MKVLIIGAGFSNWLARLPIGKKITEVFLQADTNFLKCALENILYTDPNNRYVGVQVRDRNPEDIWSDINYFSNHRIPLSVPAYNKLDNNIKNPKLKEYLNFITNNTEIIKGKPEIFLCVLNGK